MWYGLVITSRGPGWRLSRIMALTALGGRSTQVTLVSSPGSAFPPGQGEVEGGALVHPALGPDAAAVAVNHPLDDCETDTCPLELSLAVQALEDAEEFTLILHKPFTL
jgi:hypothetical protein